MSKRDMEGRRGGSHRPALPSFGRQVLVLSLMLCLVGLAVACGQPATPTASSPNVAPQAPAASASPIAAQAPTTVAPSTAAKTAATAAPDAAPPQYGGVLTRGVTGEPANFDPFSNTSSFTLNVVAACYNSLVMFDPLNPDKVIGDLAEAWEVSPDGKAYTFKLVKNAKFHDGVPMTSADVKYTFDTVRTPPPGVTSVRKSLFASVDSIETPDDYTVRFNLKRINPSFLTTLATGWFVVAPKHILEKTGDMKKDVIGTGPFKLKEYVRGTSIELVKNPDYHVKGRPYLDGMKFYTIPDTTTMFANFRTGQILYYDGMTGDEARRAEKEFGDKVLIQSSSSFIGDPFTMNSKRKPFDDIRVRKALSLAVDRGEALKVVNQGDGAVAGLLPAGLWGLPSNELEKMPGWSKNIEANRAEAKKLLAEAGYPNGFSTTILARKAAGTHETRAVFLADQFAKIGVQAKVDIQETAAYNDTLSKRNFDIATTVIASLANDPDFLLGDYYTCEGGQNWSGVCIPEVDELFVKQSQTLDPAERKKLVNQLEVAAINGFGTVNLYFKGKFMGTSRQVHNLLMHPEPDNNRRMQDVWLSK